MQKIIEIPQDVNEYIQKLFYEWQGSLKIIDYLVAQNIKNEYLNYYTELSLAKHTELEVAKQQTVHTYVKIEEPFDYTFDFDNSAIICTMK